MAPQPSGGLAPFTRAAMATRWRPIRAANSLPGVPVAAVTTGGEASESKTVGGEADCGRLEEPERRGRTFLRDRPESSR